MPLAKGKRNMSRDNTLLELLRWTPRETFFRDYYYADGAGKAALLARPDIPDQMKREALNPESFPANETEESFFTTGRNVSLVRHTRYQPQFLHDHAFFEMLYVVTGGCGQVLQGREQRFVQGDLCLLAPGVVHGVTVFDDSVVLNILIRSSTFMDIFLNAVRDKSHLSAFFLGSMYDNQKLPYLTFHTGSDDTLRDYILQMYEEQQHADSFSDRIICSLLTIFFAQLTRGHSGDLELPEGASGQTPYGEELMSYIMENYDTVTLNNLAEAFHFSVPYCSKLVKSACGLPFSELITRIRMQQGLNLLQTTQMSVADISLHVGYKNPETFIRCFSRTFHRTPGQHRRTG